MIVFKRLLSDSCRADTNLKPWRVTKPDRRSADSALFLPTGVAVVGPVVDDDGVGRVVVSDLGCRS